MTLFADFVTNAPLTFARMRQLLEDQGGGIQEGVLASGDFKVSQRAAGGANMSVDVAVGAGWIDIDSGTRQGFAHVYNDAIANGVVTNSHATLPRIDRIVIQYNDTSIPAGVGGDIPTLRVIAGTPTSGATLDNETGIAALPNDAMQIATVLIPAASATVTNANIRDRRKWARGSQFFGGGGGTGAHTTASASLVSLGPGSYDARMECTGLPFDIMFDANVSHSVAGQSINLVVQQDGATVLNRQFNGPAVNAIGAMHLDTTYTPTAGSHLFTWLWQTGAATATMYNAGGIVPQLRLRENVRQNASNT